MMKIEFIPNTKLTDEHLERIKHILKENNDFFIPSLYERIEFEGTLDEKIEFRINERIRKYHYILASTQGNIVGFTEFFLGDGEIYNSTHYCLNIGTSAVSPCSQGKGIAKELYKKVDELAQYFGVEAVLRSTWTKNERQLKLYSSFGYSEVERLMNERGHGNHLVKYCKWFPTRK